MHVNESTMLRNVIELTWLENSFPALRKCQILLVNTLTFFLFINGFSEKLKNNSVPRLFYVRLDNSTLTDPCISTEGCKL